MTCHKAHNVFDVVPGDVVGSVILATSAATVQVCPCIDSVISPLLTLFLPDICSC